MSTATAKKSRLFYIDNLRILLTILVIMHHFTIVYGGPGGFYYSEDGPMSDISEILMTLLLAINQAFFMGFFFMISSYFSPGSVDRKGAGVFLRDRLKRLGFPLLFYMFILDPLTAYFVNRIQGDEYSLRDFYTYKFTSILNFNSAQMWFLAALLFFAIVYLIWRSIFKPMPQTEESAPGNLPIALFALGLGLVTFTVRLWMPVGSEIPLVNWQLSHFTQYIALYIVGMIAYRKGWFESLKDSQGRIWLYVVIGMVLLFPVLFIAGGAMEGVLDPFFGGLHWQSFVYSIWEQFMCLGMVVSLLVRFRNRFNDQGHLAKTMSGAAYATYVFHAPAIVLLAFILRPIRLDMGLKYLLVVPFAVAFSFLIGYFIKKLPVVRDIL